ncbi:MAG: DUF883 family protein [Betaproteobacteria bacterium]|nr:DUF883 family protein [Betaproteobacteria bacterium]
MSNESVATKDKLAQDLKIVIADAEELLRATASQAGEKVAAARATDEYVHEHPWRAVGIAAGAGLIIGLLIGRR